MKKIEIIIIVALLLLVALFFGCKKEPDYQTPEYELAEPCDFQPTQYYDYVVIWPDVFTDPNYEYPLDKQYERAIADGLMGWGLCKAGNEPPENFGQGMVNIGIIIGGFASPDNLMRLSSEILKEE